jgi:NAD(P)-dependent dehydrogenase (short-subunit alcohol dehydrogenase family)
MERTSGTILLIGASRGLGLGLVREYLNRGWRVVATVRDPARAGELTALASAHHNRLRIEKLDVVEPGGANKLNETLAGTSFNVIFVVAGQASSGYLPIHETAPDAAAREFLTNSFAPPVVAEALLPRLASGGTMVFMTSILGSLANSSGGMELYNASKAALNMLGIGFSKRHADLKLILMHPGWVKTDMGGDSAPLDVETSARGMADVIAKHGGAKGLEYLDYAGKSIAW